ncbi:hypothetical protein [Rickettsia bellii]|uniref:Putative membrane protein n=1 Tax=Rickettsia bellii str. RML An4 TaxID=1359193 RepID=A0A0F3QE84_RICBE|nr:hypothetical protein [Rickettsia bellii]KJV90562.1 putative membrane protein [Rickettsia bellii str. RML An4]
MYKNQNYLVGTFGVSTFLSAAAFGFLLIPAKFFSCSLRNSSPIFFATSLLPFKALLAGFLSRLFLPFEVSTFSLL